MNSRFVLAILILLSIAVGGYEAAAFHSGHVVGHEFRLTWSALVYPLLLALWIESDSKDRREIYRPFELGFLIFTFWPAYLPYYLLRTRRALGLLWLLGFLILLALGGLLVPLPD
jgi:hypothetical protein